MVGVMHAEIQGYKDGPKLPDVPYGVHDPERPQPIVVETAGAVEVPAPKDALVLFSGHSLDSFTSGGNKPLWEVKNGVAIASGGDIQTKEEFGALQLHFEWRLPESRAVNGQQGGNSGVFLMGLYEVQILQSHENPTYPDGQAAAIYGQLPPLVNATAPQGEWQSFDITFVPPVYRGRKCVKPAIVTVIHNGVVVQNAEELIGPTQHQKLAEYPDSHPEKGPLSFQFHGDPVEFRNMWVRPLGERDTAK